MTYQLENVSVGPIRGTLLVHALGLSLLFSACMDPLVLERPAPHEGTLGEQVFQILHRDLARSADRGDQRAAAFTLQEPVFVGAVDRALPAGELDGFERYVLETLPLYDGGDVPRLVRRMAAVFEALSSDTSLLATYARYIHQLPTFLRLQEEGLLSRTARFEQFPLLLETAVEFFEENDGFQPDDRGNSDLSGAFTTLLQSALESLSDYDEPLDPNRSSRIISSLFLYPDRRLKPDSIEMPLWVLDLDYRGRPLVNMAGPGGEIFVDLDGDGLADLSDVGALVSQDPAAAEVPPFGEEDTIAYINGGYVLFYDDMGRLVDVNGETVYRYMDLWETPLGYLFSGTSAMIEAGHYEEAALVFQGLLEPLEWNGEDHVARSDTPLMALAWSGLQLLNHDISPQLLQSLSELLLENEQTLAQLFAALDESGLVVDEEGDYLEPDNGLIDDLLPEILELIQQEGFVDELLSAIQDPMSSLGLYALAEMAHGTNEMIRPALTGDYNLSVAACLEDYQVGTLARYECIRRGDRAEIYSVILGSQEPESPDGTSVLQRLLHLVHDGSGWPFMIGVESATLWGADLTEIIALPTLITIPDVAAAFFDSIAGNFCWADYVNEDELEDDAFTSGLVSLSESVGLTDEGDSLSDLVSNVIVTLSEQVGVHVDACPTPGQLLRFFNLPEYSLELAGTEIELSQGTCRAGFVYQEHHADTLYALEASGAVDGLYPVIKVLSDRGLSSLFSRLIHRLYRHYPEPGTLYLRADGSSQDLLNTGLRRFESTWARLFQGDLLLSAIQELAAVLQAQVIDERPAVGLWEQGLVHLITADETLQNWAGESEAERGDGQMTTMSRYYLLAQALESVDDLLAEDTDAEAAWTALQEAASAEFSAVVMDEEGHYLMADSRGIALLNGVLQVLASHLLFLQEQGRLQEVVIEDWPLRIERQIQGPALGAVVQLVDALQGDPGRWDLGEMFLSHLSGNGVSLEAIPLMQFAYLLTAIFQDSYGYPQLSRFLNELLAVEEGIGHEHDPRPIIVQFNELAGAFLAVDDDQVFSYLLQRMIDTSSEERAPAAVLAEVFRQVNRQVPAASVPLTAGDLAEIQRTFYEYLQDEKHGLERAFDLLDSRYGDTSHGH